ncbi:Uncharacterised protein [Urinicoccus massiliensis]|uniref:Uncharacterized protein n=1 Tax=Urinicoccus massiliensis TaxID=1723382 RepID=A0A8H2MF92_9FIRM|nr:hypothetical protein [Urinicoccus massiliensis]VFB16550.1 Uncharacterised protein [Urinicoccus massiliensis]
MIEVQLKKKEMEIIQRELGELLDEIGNITTSNNSLQFKEEEDRQNFLSELLVASSEYITDDGITNEGIEIEKILDKYFIN